MESLGRILDAFHLSDQVFFLFAVLAVLGAVGTAISTNLVHSAFSLLASLFAVAALFAWLSADYLAIVQLIVYVGGILVLFLFAVMLTHKITDVRRSNPSSGVLRGALLAGGIGAIGIQIAWASPWRTVAQPLRRETTAPLGDLLLSTYLLPFEALSILILGALVGAVIMARKEIQD